MGMYGPINTGVAAGGAGVATSNATTTHAIKGKVLGVAIQYNDSPPVTTDVTVATSGTNLPALVITKVSNSATGVYSPVGHAVIGADGAAIANEYAPPAIDDTVTVTIAQADNGDSADVWLLLED